jgi:hypothetical protein
MFCGRIQRTFSLREKGHTRSMYLRSARLLRVCEREGGLGGKAARRSHRSVFPWVSFPKVSLCLKGYKSVRNKVRIVSRGSKKTLSSAPELHPNCTRSALAAKKTTPHKITKTFKSALKVHSCDCTRECTSSARALEVHSN